MKKFYTTFSINKHTKLIFETSQPSDKLSFDHYSGIMLQYKDQKIRVQDYNITAWSLYDFSGTLQTLINERKRRTNNLQKIDYPLSFGFVSQRCQIVFDLEKSNIFLKVIPLYPCCSSTLKRPYPASYLTRKEFNKNLKPLVSVEVPFSVIKRWYKKASIIYQQTVKNYERDSILSKERDNWHKQYSFSLETNALKIVFNMTAPFEKMF